MRSLLQVANSLLQCELSRHFLILPGCENHVQSAMIDPFFLSSMVYGYPKHGMACQRPPQAITTLLLVFVVTAFVAEVKDVHIVIVIVEVVTIETRVEVLAIRRVTGVVVNRVVGMSGGRHICQKL
jgi:hypothetical protein